LNGITIIGEAARRPLYVGTACYSNCESHQDYKGIFSDRSTGVFNGKIYVKKRPKNKRIQKTITSY
jgi:Fe-S cluster assembly protein SufD